MVCQAYDGKPSIRFVVVLSLLWDDASQASIIATDESPAGFYRFLDAPTRRAPEPASRSPNVLLDVFHSRPGRLACPPSCRSGSAPMRRRKAELILRQMIDAYPAASCLLVLDYLHVIKSWIFGRQTLRSLAT